MTSHLRSPLWTAEELRRATDGQLDTPVTVHGVSIDTRQITPGDLFIALAGQTDGHRFIRQAFRKGAACVMAHRADIAQLSDEPTQAGSPLTEDEKKRILWVEDTQAGLEALGRFARARFSGGMIAVTGSVGKTTTKEMLRNALTPYGHTHAAVASFNNHIGVPLTLARLPREAAFCICEVGMNHPGEILPLARQVQPNIAVISTIGSAHLGHMGSLEAIAREKAALFSALTDGGTALAPDDTPYPDLLAEAVPQNGRFWKAGISPKAEIHLSSPVCSAAGSTAEVTMPDNRTALLTLSAPGPHLVRNAALALGVVAALGLELPPALTALAGFQPGSGRGHSRKLPGDILLLDESYNASSTSMRAALQTLALLPARRHLVALGDIRELGDFAEDEHRALASDVQTAGALAFCCGPHMRHLYDALPPELQGGWAPDAARLAPLLQAALTPGDTLLVKGSFGSRMRDLIAALDDTSSSDSSSAGPV
ncbi:UDP-N-acetylmuramoyl-tripeptide--D-alanyl-D-alanine ligase [Oecophyllibacter saccharovorans]|uniref:UDP-N-acetylmuramoyl-tripeptide--D-alanyl-D- alanine ligase n=1 Tax=Oecophyllibacter saccharovorans TaxID=2558360 RepID=UPI001175C511|nr:UDP-N-acetylmuramoyl-tripeptide--D-alanyl-D-alanine ligase [Oecophyllibacter saccharovorans]TPW34864.1 UDP-N-acetylmuramoyl-tripeptide--D-alanyl-D-alanine ligase [Oecophyllibacter saccharovorans]